MTNIYLEVGDRNVFACSLDWPGWCRAGHTEGAAMQALAEVAPRYAEVVRAAKQQFPKVERFTVVERIRGNTTTDFGAPDKPARADYEGLTRARAKRLASLLQCSWDLLDRVVADAPAELLKGPRGGGRHRDEVLAHVQGSEAGYARNMGADLPDATPGEVRLAIIERVLKAKTKPSPPEKGWPVPYAVRRITWHTLDHAWEIQDRS